MPRAGPKRVESYSLEFKRTAVRLSELEGVEVQAVANALDIHPMMLTRWRRESRAGALRGGGAAAPLKTPPLREIKRLQVLEREHAMLREEHELLKKPSGSVPHASGRIRVHRRTARSVPSESVVLVVWRQAWELLRVASARGEYAPGAGPGTTRGDPEDLQRESWDVR